MAAAVRIKLVGEDPELDRIESVARGSNLACQRFHELDEACESQEGDPAELFVFGPSLYFQSHLNQVSRLSQKASVALAVGPRLPNLAKILMPRLVYTAWSDQEILWELQLAADCFKRDRRLEALRDHQKRSLNVEANPAIHLVTNLMRKCTIAEEYKDLLAAVLSLRPVIDFQDASLVILAPDGKPLEGWHISKEGKDRLHPLAVSFAGADIGSALADGEVTSFTSSDRGGVRWEDFTNHPWSFGIGIRFSLALGPRGPKSVSSAVLLLFRRELVPFLERDHWLLETTHGPLALALEKVAILKAIGQASREWRSTFDGISEPLTVIDSNYQIVKANRAFAALIDQDIKKVKTKRCYTLLANRRTPCVGCPVGSEQQPQGGTRIQLQGKNRKDLLVWSYGIRTGMENYHFQFYRNVSKETTLASTLIQSEKMAALGRLVGAVAHEINNPLAGILATSQILLEESKEQAMDPSLLEDLEEIRSAAWRSKKIIDDLLGFTSPDERPKEPIHVLEAIRSALTFSKAALTGLDVVVECDEPGPLTPVPVSALQQVLFNLITNAAHAMGGKGRLRIRVQTEAGAHLIYVEDTGPGITLEQLRHIFDPFHTSKREGMGTGLGLSIVRNLTQKMGARIEVSSKLGTGTTFTITLPSPDGGAA